MNEIERSEAGRFQPGTSGNPAGKRKGAGSGRSKALGALDRIVGSEDNIAVLEAALEEALRRRPLWFFVNIIMPLLPKESKGVLEGGDRIVEWRGLLSYGAGGEIGKRNGGE
jgi:hypothetical protein